MCDSLLPAREIRHNSMDDFRITADPVNAVIQPTGTSPFIVIGTAVNTQLSAQTMQQVLGYAGFQTPLLNSAFNILEQDAQELAINSAGLISNQMVGQLIDIVA